MGYMEPQDSSFPRGQEFEDLDYNLSLLSIPALVVDSNGKVLNYNESAALFFSNGTGIPSSIEDIASSRIWRKIKSCKVSVGRVDDAGNALSYYYRSFGSFFILTVESTCKKMGRHMSSEARYIAYLTHHINNPLTVVKNTHELLIYGFRHLVDYLRADRAVHSDKKMKEIVSMVEESLDGQKESISQLEQNMRYLRTVGSIPSGGRVKCFNSVRLNALVVEILGRLKFMTAQIDIDTSFDPAVVDSVLNVDLEDFVNLFYIVFENAIYAIRRTEGLDRGKIQISLDEAGDSLFIRIENNGRRMGERELAHCFDPFYSTKEEAEGLGLGLTNALVIVNGYCGKIMVSNRSEADSGVVCQLVFPKSRVMK